MKEILTDTESVAMARESARAMLASEWPVERAVTLAEDPRAVRTLWRRAAEQGWTALAPDGSEMGLAAALAILEELGRAACPLPLGEAVLLNGVAPTSELHAGEIVPAWVWPIDQPPGFELTLTTDLHGRAAFVANAEAATHFVWPSGPAGEIVIIPAASRGVSIKPTPGLNLPPLSEVSFEHVTDFVRVETSFDLAALAPLQRLMLSARALGAARRGLEMLVEYAKVRTQFGQRIGQYQAIQHKLANCLIGIEICRLSILRAGTEPETSRLYAASVAAANAGQYLRHVVLELHHGFGGISFWDEHEMPRHFRAIHGDLVRLGGVQAARADLAEALFRAPMPELDLGAAVNAFGQEVRTWLKANWDHRYSPETEGQPLNHRKAMPGFSRKVGEKGWIGLTWPKEYGGQERSALAALVYEEEMAYAHAPVALHLTAATMMAPTIIRFGTAAQKAYFLPRISTGEISFSLGYSEPDHGSDLAGIRTKATRTPNGWVIDGQKIFTSSAGFSSHIWLIARTNPAEPRHAGISVFMVPLATKGISMRPMMGLNRHRANVVFFDEVHVPDDALIGGENDGWKVITAALAYERVTLAGLGARARSYFDKMVAQLKPRQNDPLVRDRIGAFAAEIEGARLLAVQTALTVQRGEVPVHQAAMAKVFSSELMERLSEAAFDLLGPGAALQAEADSALIDGNFEYAVRDALLYTIGGGTNEIQRTIIALRGLGLPR